MTDSSETAQCMRVSQRRFTLTVGQLVKSCTTFIQFIIVIHAKDLQVQLASLKSQKTPPVHADAEETSLLSGQPKVQQTAVLLVNPLIRTGVSLKI